MKEVAKGKGVSLVHTRFLWNEKAGLVRQKNIGAITVLHQNYGVCSGNQRKAIGFLGIIGEMDRDEDGVLVMSLPQIEEAISLLSGLDEALLEFTGNIHFRFDPQKIDWDLNKYSDLVDHWKNPDGTEVYTLVNSFTRAENIEYYLKGALRVGKPVEFEY